MASSKLRYSINSIASLVSRRRASFATIGLGRASVRTCAHTQSLHSQYDYHSHNQARRSLVVVSQHKAEDVVEISAAKAEPTEQQSTTQSSILPVNNNVFPTSEGELENTLIVTDSCWKQMERLAQKKGHDLDKVYLRVFVDAGGCSGFTYQFEYHSTDDSEDEIDDAKEDLVWVGPTGARVVVDIGSMGFLRGATLDYVMEMIKSSFEIRDNPQSESACGCGSSFAVKNFSANPALD